MKTKFLFWIGILLVLIPALLADSKTTNASIINTISKTSQSATLNEYSSASLLDMEKKIDNLQLIADGEQHYMNLVEVVYWWVMIFGSILLLIAGIAAVLGLADIRKIRDNAKIVAKEEAKKEAQVVATDVAKTKTGEYLTKLTQEINKSLNAPVVKEIKDRQDKIDAQILEIKDAIQLLNNRLNDVQYPQADSKKTDAGESEHDKPKKTEEDIPKKIKISTQKEDTTKK